MDRKDALRALGPWILKLWPLIRFMDCYIVVNYSLILLVIKTGEMVDLFFEAVLQEVRLFGLMWL